MSRKITGTKSNANSTSARTPLKQNLPHHNLPDPYSRLQSIGPEDAESLYTEIADKLKQSDPKKAAQQLLKMVQDESYYDYDGDAYVGGATGDARGWTCLHALRVLALMGEAGTIGIEPLLPLLNSEDDYLREDVPFYYAEMGQPAIGPLARVLADSNADTYQRAGAGESLAEIAEKHPHLRELVIPPLEQALATERHDDALNGFLIINLCDLASKESMPLVEAAFREDRVDDTIIDMAEVQEHFGLEVTAERPKWEYGPGEPRRVPPGSAPLALPRDDDDDERTPYVAPEKVGRNEPCPCGSGKKYKKCCGS
jgi:hypothetical protein